LRFRLLFKRTERDLRRVEKLGGLLFGNLVNEDAVGRAGDEVADAFIIGKRGHGFAVCGAGLVGGEKHVYAAAGGSLKICIEGALPGGAAMFDGGPGLFGVGLERRDRFGLDQAGFRGGFWVHGGFSL